MVFMAMYARRLKNEQEIFAAPARLTPYNKTGLRQCHLSYVLEKKVGPGGIEPPTSSVSR